MAVSPESSGADPGASRRGAILLGVKEILSQASGIPVVGLDENATFLELGFDSLLLVQVTQTLESRFRVRISIIQLLEESNTAAILSQWLDGRLGPDWAPGNSVGPGSAARKSPSPQVSGAACPAISPAASAVSPSASPPASGSASGKPASLVERVVAQQMDIMRQQLETLRQLSGQSKTTVTPSDVPAPIQPAAVSSPAPVRDTFIPPFQPMQLGGRSGLTPAQQDYLDEFIAGYCRRTAESKLQTQAYRPFLADARATMGFKLAWKELVYPIIGSRAAGAKIWDLDENEYVDVAMGFGLHPFGHSPEFLVEALQQQMSRSLALGPQSERAGRVAQLICEMSGNDRAIFCNSGTEALMGAVRAARTHTRRNRIVVFNGSYHGWADGVLARPTPGVGASGGVGISSRPSAPGVDPHAVEDVIVLEYGRPESLDWIRAHAGELAAVLVEPVQSRQPHLQPREFLHELRRITQDQGALLVFDEMITGFRVHPGGAQAVFGVHADLVTYGKHLGGGMPIGVVAGRREVMDVFDGGSWQFGDESYPEREKILFTGAFFKHPLTMAAAEVILERLKKDPGILESLNRKTEGLVRELNEGLEKLKAPFRMVNFGSMFKIHWQVESPNRGLFFYHLLSRGIYYPVETSTCFLSTLHTDADLVSIREAYLDSVRVMMEKGFFFEGAVADRASAPAIPSAPPMAAPPTVAVPVDVEKALVAPQASRLETSPNPVEPVSEVGRRVAGMRTAGGRIPEFSLYFFGNYPAAYSETKYSLILDAVRFADRAGFTAVWLPERHFHSFGGFSPNPSVLAAALAAQTRQIQLRAGSVVIPLHHPVRAAEDWALVDNLSGGRVAISFATGWHPNDFIFAPENFSRRHEITQAHMELVKRLWRGEEVVVKGGAGNDLPIRLHPQPKQRELPVWISGVSVEAFKAAGKMGVNILTNLQVMTIPELGERIRIYREARAEAGHVPADGRVTVLLHGYLSSTVEKAREEAKEPFLRYVKASLEISSGKIVSEGGKADVNAVPEAEMRKLLEEGYARYLRENRVLIGTVDSCGEVVEELLRAGVDEIGCLLDFGLDHADALRSLGELDILRRRFVESRPEPVTKRVLPQVFHSMGALTEEPTLIGMTDAQQGLLALCRMDEQAARAYQESITLQFRGSLRIHDLEWAWQFVLSRHEALRITFSEEGPFQIIQPSVTSPLEVVVLPEGGPATQESRVEAQLRAWESEVPDLVHGPLARARLLKVSESEHLLVITVHHLISDGHSFGLLVKDLQAAYNHRVRGGEIPSGPATPFRQHVEWERTVIRSAEYREAQEYWQKRFAGGIPVLELPSGLPRAGQFSHRGDRVHGEVPASVVRLVRQHGARQGCTLFVTLLAGFQTLIHRLSAQEEVVIGITSSPPALNAANDTFGYRVQLVPILSRMPAGPDVTIATFLKEQRRSVLEGTQNQPFFFGQLIKKQSSQRDFCRPALVSVTFNLDREWPGFEFADLEVKGDSRASRNPRDTTRFELNLNVLEQRDGSLRLEMDFSTDLMDEKTASRWLGYYLQILEGLSNSAQVEGSWSQLPWLPEGELTRLLKDWNNTAQDFGPALCLHQAFEQQVMQSPEAVALVAGQDTWTYRRLNERCNQLAHLLRRHDVGPDKVVVVCVPRSISAVVAMLGVMKTGAAYIPMDVEDPRGRFDLILEDTRARVVLTHEDSARQMKGCDAEVISLDTLDELLDREPVTSPDSSVTPDHLAYIIYTSGSTGQPKGAMIPHRSIVNEIRWMLRKYPLTQDDAVLQKSSFGFDASVWEIYTALLSGARLVLSGPTDHRDPPALVDKIQKHRVTTMIVVPSFLDALLMEPSFSRCTTLRRVFCGGEAVAPDLVTRFYRALPTPSLHNLYGPTEAAIASTSWDFKRGEELDTVPIGYPVDNARCHVVGPGGYLLPVDVPGELWISGAGVGRGYWKREDLTLRKFGIDPFVPGGSTPLYRTGDRVRRRSDGAIEFLGRTDHQIKLRGYRIEPGEIEEALRGHPWVKDSVVALKQDPSGHPRLVAYVVFMDGHFNDAPQWSQRDLGDLIRQHLRQSLPEYMIPASMVSLRELPQLTNGKVDRRSLPEPEWNLARDESSIVAPRTPLESTLTELWARVLGLARVGVNDNIFDLGGDSLLISRLSLEARRSGLRVTPKLIFENQTIEALAKAMEQLAPVKETARESELRRRVAELTPEEVSRMLAERKSRLSGQHPS